MPVVAIGFAAALDIGAMSALAAGTLTTLAAVTAIGATVSAVGAVTHNKTLSLVGMGLGVVGAIGTLATGAGVFDNVSDLFSSSSGAAAAGPGGASIFDTPGVYDAAAGGAGAGESALADTGALWTGTTADLPGAINATSSLAPAEGNAAAIASAGQPGGALAQSLSTAPEAATAGGAGATDAATGAAAATSGAASNAAETAFNAEVNAASIPGFSASNAATITDGLAKMSSSASGGLLSWAKNNPLLSFGLIQAGGSFISGLTNPMTPAQIDALNAQADVNRATATLIQRETANQGSSLPTASVTGRPEPTAGLINSKPVGSALITGTPNTGAPPPSLLSTGTTG